MSLYFEDQSFDAIPEGALIEEIEVSSPLIFRSVQPDKKYVCAICGYEYDDKDQAISCCEGS